MSEVASAVSKAQSSQKKLAKEIPERLSQELVIALVGPVGSGVSTAGEIIRERLIQKFAYKVPDVFKVSAVIAEEMPRVGLAPPPKSPLNDYVDKMQTAGNLLRKELGENYLIEKIIERLVVFRSNDNGYVDEEKKVIQPGRRAYVIDSLKNIEELNFLRHIYGSSLCVFGIFAPDKVRLRRLLDRGADEGGAQKVIDRDQGEIPTFGQMTRKVFVEADFFICNDQKEEILRRHIDRYLELVFDCGTHTPTRGEAAMAAADSAASSSACMSQKVGVAIISENGDLIAVGRNDAPKFGGGLYSEEDQTVIDDNKKIVAHDHRCFRWKKAECLNDQKKEEITKSIVRELKRLTKRKTKEEDVRAVVENSGLIALTEYSRAVHAEMDAMLATAREAKHSLVGSTLYSTVYPCHTCARHIVAAGVASVVYLRPYKKSLALELHGDAISEDVEERGKVIFRQYEGVAPRNHSKVFQPKGPRKENGRYYRPPSNKAEPLFRVPLDGVGDYEWKVIAELKLKEQNVRK